MDNRRIAEVAHQVNKAYCEAIGDDSQVDWEFAPFWQKDSAILGVNFHRKHPEADPKASHKSWLQVKADDGWTYGIEKDGDLKTHPCFLPYEELPVEQKAKDYIFRAIVHALK